MTIRAKINNYIPVRSGSCLAIRVQKIITAFPSIYLSPKVFYLLLRPNAFEYDDVTGVVRDGSTMRITIKEVSCYEYN